MQRGDLVEHKIMRWTAVVVEVALHPHALVRVMDSSGRTHERLQD